LTLGATSFAGLTGLRATGFRVAVFLAAALAFNGAALRLGTGFLAAFAGFVVLARAADDLAAVFLAAAARCALGRAELVLDDRLLTDVLVEARRAPEDVRLKPFVTGLLICTDRRVGTAAKLRVKNWPRG
jgi:hypothetical protein